MSNGHLNLSGIIHESKFNIGILTLEFAGKDDLKNKSGPFFRLTDDSGPPMKN